jgi:GNAT superfamily N-acetyltransferase
MIFLKSGDALFQPFFVNGLEQIVDTVYRKGLHGIFVECRRKDDGAMRTCLFYEKKGIAVGELYVEKQNVGLGIILEPDTGLLDGPRQKQHFPVGTQLLNHILEQAGCRKLVFDNSGGDICCHDDRD